MVVDMVVYIYTWWWTLRTTEEAEEGADMVTDMVDWMVTR